MFILFAFNSSKIAYLYIILPETIIVDIKYDNPTKSNSLASELKVGNSLNSDISASNNRSLS